MAFAYHIRELTAEATVPEFVAQFVHVEKFLPACRQCPRYNTRWTCPPFDFDPMDVWGGYTGLRLYARILDADGAGQPMDDATEALLREKRLYREKLRQWEQAAPGSQMLLAGTCDQCQVCEKSQGRPCHSPELLRYSIEALAAMWRGACGTISTCRCCGARTAPRRTIWCWWAAC